jgi:hypothetical protein
MKRFHLGPGFLRVRFISGEGWRRIVTLLRLAIQDSKVIVTVCKRQLNWTRPIGLCFPGSFGARLEFRRNKN